MKTPLEILKGIIETSDLPYAGESGEFWTKIAEAKKELKLLEEEKEINDFEVKDSMSMPKERCFICSKEPCMNPLHHDQYHMGTKMGTNIMILHANHNDSEMKYMIVVNTVTGKKIHIQMKTEI